MAIPPHPLAQKESPFEQGGSPLPPVDSLPAPGRRFIVARMSDETELKAAFRKFDKDGSGFIDEAEFAALVTSLGVNLSPEKVATAFLAIDVNGNGRIEFGEFSAWWTKYQAKS